MSRVSSLQSLLEQLKQAARINLSDMYIQDDGAKLLCQYLRNNSNLTCLELRGNQITSQGLQEIIQTLRNCPAIRLLYLDWNRIGSPSKTGLEALGQFLESTRSLQHLSLQNNELGPDEMNILFSAIEKNTDLLSLDIKWNPVGPRAGAMIAQAVNVNRSLLYLESGGCDISPNDLDRIENVLETHRNSNPIPRQRILQVDEVQQPSQTVPASQQFQTVPANQQFQSVPASQMVAHLEQILEQERLHSLQIKQRMERELDELSRRDRSDTRLLEDLEAKAREYEADNRAARYAVDKIRDECQLVERSQEESLRALEEKVRQNEFTLAEQEKKHRTNLDRVLNENNFRVKDISRDWESRRRTVEDRTRVLENENQLLEDELRQLGERQALLRVTYDQELRELGRRVEEEEYQKFNVVAQNLDAKIQAAEEALNVLRRRNEDVVVEYRRRDRIGREELSTLHEEVEQLKQESRAFEEQNQKYRVECERVKQEVRLKETAILKYEQEINTLNEQIELKRGLHRDQLEQLIGEQGAEQGMWEQEREKQYQRVIELEKLLQQSHSENSRLRQEFQRLSEVIQFNVHKVVQQTFIDNQYF